MNTKELCKHENLYKLKGVATSRLFGALILINFSGYLNLQWIETGSQTFFSEFIPQKVEGITQKPVFV